MTPGIEFRIPISSTTDFYQRVRLFCAALQRTESGPKDSLVRVVVGDGDDLLQVQRDNSWSNQYNVEWHRAPDEIFATHSYHGTGDFRYLLPDRGSDLVVLSDADTILLKPIFHDFQWMIRPEPCVAGHMAHVPAWFEPVSGAEPKPHELWPFLFREFSIPWPDELYRYSLDVEAEMTPIPAYYNLGFVVLNRAALRIFRQDIFAVQKRLKRLIDSYMRCQIAVTLISYQHGMHRMNLPAIFNAANDLVHLSHNRVQMDQVKVLHYLRTDEVDKSSFLTVGRSAFLRATLENPANQLLQRLVLELVERGPDW
jgi:hypothetical protein